MMITTTRPIVLAGRSIALELQCALLASIPAFRVPDPRPEAWALLQRELAGGVYDLQAAYGALGDASADRPARATPPQAADVFLGSAEYLEKAIVRASEHRGADDRGDVDSLGDIREFARAGRSGAASIDPRIAAKLPPGWMLAPDTLPGPPEVANVEPRYRAAALRQYELLTRRFSPIPVSQDDAARAKVAHLVPTASLDSDAAVRAAASDAADARSYAARSLMVIEQAFERARLGPTPRLLDMMNFTHDRIDSALTRAGL